MRTTLRVFVLTALLAPAVAFAAIPPELPRLPSRGPLQGLTAPNVAPNENDEKIPAPPPIQKLCKRTQGVPLLKAVYEQPFLMSDIAMLKDYLNDMVKCVNVCVDEDITITVAPDDKKIILKTVAEQKCGTSQPTLGDAKKYKTLCISKENQPMLTIHTPALAGKLSARDIGPKSRCNPDVGSTVNSVIDRMNGTPDLDGLKNDLDKLDKLPVVAPPQNAGTDALREAFTNLKFEKDDVDKFVNNPKAAADFLAAAQEKDEEGMQKAAKDAGVELNPDVKNNIVALSGNEFQEQVVDPLRKGGYDWQNGGPTGFGDESDSREAAPGTPLASQGSLDQIRSVSGALCTSYGIQDCKQFGNNMIATFYQECGGRANCMGHSSSYAGSFALSAGEYNKGITSYMNNCDQSTAACTTVRETCAGDMRGTHLCNAAAASANHARIEPGVQAATSNPYQQAAMHMMYQLMPAQTIRALTSSDPSSIFSMSLGGSCGSPETSLWALCKNGVSLAPGATGADAINTILARYGTLRQGVMIASNGTAGPVPVSVASASPFGGMLGFSSPYPAQFSGPAFAGSPFAQASPVRLGSSGYGSYPGYNTAPVQTASLNQTPQAIGQPSTISQTGSQSDSTQSQPGVLSPADRLRQALGLPTGQSAQQTYSGPPAATLLVQPKTIARGGAVTLIWSSAGMRADTPCRVLINETYVVAQGNNGTKRIQTSSATTLGPMSVRLRCVAWNGQVVERTDSAMVN